MSNELEFTEGAILNANANTRDSELTFEPIHPAPGAVRLDNQEVEWRLWAPFQDRLALLIRTGDELEVVEMERRGEYHFARLAGIADGSEYLLRMGSGDYPDPASRWQPQGVHGPSAVFTPQSYSWTDSEWSGVPREELVFYELHVGTFTAEGTFDAAIARLPELADLGITAIEVMPVAQFPGGRNWGYDGVFPYAVQNTYGGPVGLQRFVNAAHHAGLGVILDVVYNHFGPEGNVIPRFGPYFTSIYLTPWGDAMNFDEPFSDAVRSYVIENALMWVRDFHLDGLRLDAVHAIFDFGARHILAELQSAVQEVARREDRIVHVIAESDSNDPRLIDPPDRNGLGLSAVWADEFHHCLWAVIVGESMGYFEPFRHPRHLAKAFEEVFVHDGGYSSFRRRKHGAPVKDRHRSHFVVSIHNHDQIGNRPLGDRSPTHLSESTQRLLCGLLMLSPCLPLLFMGEEYAETHPFPYFCSFQDIELIAAVREGRRRDFEAITNGWASEVPDPQSEATFQSAKLSWEWPKGTFQGQLRDLYQDVLRFRREWPELRDRNHTKCTVLEGDNGTLLVIERGDSPSLRALANLSEQVQAWPKSLASNNRCTFSTESPRYGGGRQSNADRTLKGHELVIFRQETEST